ncbi:hypothetical protein V6N13_036648 [Hibiscus sabdariffa]
MLEFYKGVVQSSPDNIVALVLPVPLLGVDKGLEHCLLPPDQYQQQSHTPQCVQYSATHRLHSFIRLWHLHISYIHQWHHYQCIHRKVLISVLTIGWCSIHPQIHYKSVARVGAVITPLMRTRRTRMMMTTHLFEETPQKPSSTSLWDRGHMRH